MEPDLKKLKRNFYIINIAFLLVLTLFNEWFNISLLAVAFCIFIVCFKRLLRLPLEKYSAKKLALISVSACTGIFIITIFALGLYASYRLRGVYDYNTTDILQLAWYNLLNYLTNIYVITSILAWGMLNAYWLNKIKQLRLNTV